MTNYLERMTAAYLECALWLEAEDLPGWATINDLDKPSRDQASKDCARFLFKFPQAQQYRPKSVGFDLWLTRNRHGAGFWDRPELYGKENAEAFTEYAHSLGERYISAGDDATITIE